MLINLYYGTNLINTSIHLYCTKVYYDLFFTLYILLIRFASKNIKSLTTYILLDNSQSVIDCKEFLELSKLHETLYILPHDIREAFLHVFLLHITDCPVTGLVVIAGVSPCVRYQDVLYGVEEFLTWLGRCRLPLLSRHEVQRFVRFHF